VRLLALLLLLVAAAAEEEEDRRRHQALGKGRHRDVRSLQVPTVEGPAVVVATRTPGAVVATTD